MGNSSFLPQDDYSKRFIKLISVIAAVLAVIVGGVLWLTADSDPDADPEIKSNVSISDSEKIAAKTVAEEFVKSTGNFGVRSESLTADNIRTVSYLINTSDTSVRDWVTSRRDSYEFAQTQYVHAGSPLDYDTRVMADWKNVFESSRLVTMATTSITGVPSDKGEYLNIDGTEVRAIEVEVTFDSKETIRDVTANDPTWDGSYAVLEKTFPNNVAKLVVAETEDGWKVYAQRELENQFLLSSWKTPNSDAYSDRQTNFTRVDTLTPTVPLKGS